MYMASIFNFLVYGRMRLLKTKYPQYLRPILYVELNSDEFNSHQLKKKPRVGTKIALGMVYKKKISFQYRKKGSTTKFPILEI